jgi:hypothetical protein
MLSDLGLLLQHSRKLKKCNRDGAVPLDNLPLSKMLCRTISIPAMRMVFIGARRCQWSSGERIEGNRRLSSRCLEVGIETGDTHGESGRKTTGKFLEIMI